MSEVTRAEDEAMSREIDAHDEHLKLSIGAHRCATCGEYISTQVNPRNITFKCAGTIPCGWSAIYPIRTLGNSERAQRDEELDLIVIAEREVIAKAKAASKWLCANLLRLPVSYDVDELIEAVTLLEAREGMKATESLQPMEITSRVRVHNSNSEIQS